MLVSPLDARSAPFAVLVPMAAASVWGILCCTAKDGCEVVDTKSPNQALDGDNLLRIRARIKQCHHRCRCLGFNRVAQPRDSGSWSSSSTPQQPSSNKEAPWTAATCL